MKHEDDAAAASSKPRSVTEQIHDNAEYGRIVLSDIARTLPDDVTVVKIGRATLKVIHDQWHVTLWWDPITNTLKGRVVGNGHAALSHLGHMSRGVVEAIEDGVRRQEAAPWTRDMPGKNKTKRKTVKETDEPDIPKDLAFGDLPIGWAKRNRKRRKT